MTRNNLIVAALALLFVALGINTYIGIDNTNTIKDTQHQQAVNLKASTHTRVVTVTQRCELTALIENVVVRLIPRYALPFVASYQGCVKQLALIIKIDRATPSP